MSQENFHFQQFLPYPSHCLAKKFFKTPILLYRLGLGKLFGNYILILSTSGRRTGKTHRTPVEYFFHQGQYYIISSFGVRPDWYQNILAKPQVTLQNGYETLCATARPPQTDEEWEAIQLYLTQSPIGKLLLAKSGEEIQGEDLLEKIKQWPALTFEPTDQPCPPILEADLVWAWPLILLGMAFDITFWWLWRRKK